MKYLVATFRTFGRILARLKNLLFSTVGFLLLSALLTLIGLREANPNHWLYALDVPLVAFYERFLSNQPKSERQFFSGKNPPRFVGLQLTPEQAKAFSVEPVWQQGLAELGLAVSDTPVWLGLALPSELKASVLERSLADVLIANPSRSDLTAGSIVRSEVNIDSKAPDSSKTEESLLSEALNTEKPLAVPQALFTSPLYAQWQQAQSRRSFLQQWLVQPQVIVGAGVSAPDAFKIQRPSLSELNPQSLKIYDSKAGDFLTVFKPNLGNDHYRPVKVLINIEALLNEQVEIIALDQLALRLENKNAPVLGLLVSSDTGWLNAQLAQLNAVAQGHYLTDPQWRYPLQIMIVVVILILASLVLLLPGLWQLLIAALTGVGLLVLSYQFYTKDSWLPVTLLIVYSLVVFLACSARRQRHRTKKLVLGQLDQRTLALLKTHVDAGHDQRAIDLLAQVEIHSRKNKIQLVQLLYKWAQRQEAVGNVASAKRIYEKLITIKSRYKDTRDKLKALPAGAVNNGSLKPEVETLAATIAVDELPMDTTVELGDTQLATIKEQAKKKELTNPADLPENKVAGVPDHLGRYSIEREIGRGAAGIVYLGNDPKIARAVAVKTMNYSDFDQQSLPDLKRRFAQEAEAAGRLRHPNIVTVFDAGETDHCAWIAMEFIDGRALSELCKKDNLLPVQTVYQITAQVAHALNYAHSKSIVHRDIKPANILFDDTSSQASVTDFGIARISDHSRTKVGEIMGSPLYMAPERLKGDNAGPQSDIYSLGVSFYQLLTAELPFSGENLAHLSYQIIHDKHRPVRTVRPQLPSSATRIINKALQKDPVKRYATALEMAQALENSLSRDFKGKK